MPNQHTVSPSSSSTVAYKSHGDQSTNPGSQLPATLVNRFPTDRIYSIVGLNTGDEGKGRVVPDLVRVFTKLAGSAHQICMVVKVNGGANSGHTVAGLKHNLVPGGVTESAVAHLCIGGSVVADPLKLDWEIRALRAHGYDVFSRLLIDERAMVSDISHRLRDKAHEMYLQRETGAGRGSTGRGISPSYADEAMQRHVPFGWLREEDGLENFVTTMKRRCELAAREARYQFGLSEEEWSGLFDALTEAERKAHASEISEGVIAAEEFDFSVFRGSEPWTIDVDAVLKRYWRVGRAFSSRIENVAEYALRGYASKMPVLAEHGQAFMLDKSYGFTPNVTASHTTPAEIYHSLGVPTDLQLSVFGCCKAYDTKVGTHRFLTQIEDGHPLGERLKQIEFGTTTGRQRMVGWSDLVERGTAIRRLGSQHIALNKLDVLGYGGDWQKGSLLQLCVGYQIHTGVGTPTRLLHQVPVPDHRRAQCTPVYIALPSWHQDIAHIRSFADLPVEAQVYVAASYAGMIVCASDKGHQLPTVPWLSFLGVGPNPDEIILDAPKPSELLRMAAVKIPEIETRLPEFTRVLGYVERSGR
jgi:adenylosuccinate synthase